MTAKTVLITGATRGIGLKFAEMYVSLGWNVIGAARNLTKARQLQVLSLYKIVQLDTADEPSILSAAQELEGEAIDLLINNAGIILGGDLNETSKDDLLKQFEVNAVGPFLVTRAFLPQLKAAVVKHGTATVAQISSRVGSIDRVKTGLFRGYYGYRASKAALNMLTTTLAVDLKSDSIAVFALHPGHVATDFNGYQAKLSVDDSVAGLVDVLTKLTMADTGKFVDYNGGNLMW